MFDKIDYSKFHPIDHWIWDRRCREFYGGWRTHLAYAWEYRRRDEVLRPWRRVLRCPFGKHHDMRSSRLEQDTDVLHVWVFCEVCGRRREATDEEHAQAAQFWQRYRQRADPETGAS